MPLSHGRYANHHVRYRPVADDRLCLHHGEMAALTPLERTAIVAIVGEAVEQRALVGWQLTHLNVRSRENTGGGFFAEVEFSGTANGLDPKTGPLGQHVYIGIDGLNYGLGMILHFTDGYAHLLEGYSVAGEETSAIDFQHVRYALISKPEPLPFE